MSIRLGEDRSQTLRTQRERGCSEVREERFLFVDVQVVGDAVESPAAVFLRGGMMEMERAAKALGTVVYLRVTYIRHEVSDYHGCLTQSFSILGHS